MTTGDTTGVVNNTDDDIRVLENDIEETVTVEGELEDGAVRTELLLTYADDADRME